MWEVGMQGEHSKCENNSILANLGTQSRCCQQTEGVLVRVKVWGSTLSPPIQFYLPQCLNIFFWRSWLELSAIKICVVCASGCEFHQGLRRGQEHVIRCCSATLYQLMGSASPVSHGAFKREMLLENGHILTLAYIASIWNEIKWMYQLVTVMLPDYWICFALLHWFLASKLSLTIL